MADLKIYSTEELRKMNAKDRTKIAEQSLAQVAHITLHLRSKEQKRSDLVKKYKRQNARIQTLNRAEQLTQSDNAN